MNPAEIIATKLLGWRLHKGDENYEDYSHFMIFSDGKPWCSVCDMPDLSDYNCIRRMEDALAEKGLLGKYILALLDQLFPVEYAYEWPKQGMDPGTYGVWHTTRATTEQRVAATLKVLESVDQQKTEEPQRIDRANQRREAVRSKAKELNKTMRCNCDLDNWEPEDISGHSHVCRIHKEALKVIKEAGL
jgi:hypothetical protein